MVDVSRREFLRRTGIGAGGVVSLGGLSALLAACGDDDESAGAEGGGSAASGGKVVKPKIGLSSTPQASYLPVIAGPILAGAAFKLPTMTVDDFTIFDSSTTVSQSALSGQIDIIGQSTMAQLLIIDKGLPFKIFAPFALSDDFVIAAHKGITSVEQLKDPSTVVASDSPGGAGQTVFDAMLKANNAGFLVTDIPKKVIIESSGERASALASGDCEATSIHLPQASAVAKEREINIIARLYGQVPNFLKETYAAKSDWLDDNIETAAAVTASVIQSSRDLLKDYATFESAVNELMEEPPPAEELKELYPIIQDNDIYPADGELTDERVQYMIDLGKEEGILKSDLTPDKVVDRRPMERAMELLQS
jgi:ABC-type nitrate/sulfonate/bicarbonate transport system substrate-binding protein